MEESDDNSTFTTVAAAEQVGRDKIASWAVSTTLRLAYIGSKRYVRVVVTPSASTILTITGALERPAQAACANPA
jgi:hypothetical protein